MDGRIAVTVLADLSANIFAVCLIVLLILLGEAAEAPPPRPDLAGQRIEALDLLLLVERAPLGGAAMVEHLFLRRSGLAVDVRADGLVAWNDGAPADLASLPPGPARLYILSGRHYAAALAALAGRPLTEMSVTPELRDARGPGFSPAFLALSKEATSRDIFVEGLARLLEGGVGPGDASPGEGADALGASATQTPATPGDLLGRLTAWLRAFFNVLMPALALIAVAVIARRYPRPIGTRRDRLS